ncbi:hypothetical protein F5888DRAFT_1800824 [Russula emetica]|nr:hypothetical protein F5888DRAFT_1800824 [Russula emetica]
MTNNDTTHRTELPKITNNSTTNNYREWKIKPYHKLWEWDLLKYIEGPCSTPPVIPALCERVTHHGVNEARELATVHIPGNADEHQQAVAAAQPWLTGNNITLSCIVAALPGHQLHLVQHTKYAKQAWESLRSIYQP